MGEILKHEMERGGEVVGITVLAVGWAVARLLGEGHIISQRA